MPATSNQTFPDWASALSGIGFGLWIAPFFADKLPSGGLHYAGIAAFVVAIVLRWIGKNRGERGSANAAR